MGLGGDSHVPNETFHVPNLPYVLIFIHNIALRENRMTSDETTLSMWGTRDGLVLTQRDNNDGWDGDGWYASTSSEDSKSSVPCWWSRIITYWRWRVFFVITPRNQSGYHFLWDFFSNASCIQLGASSGILLSGLQGIQWWRGLGWDNHWDELWGGFRYSVGTFSSWPLAPSRPQLRGRQLWRWEPSPGVTRRDTSLLRGVRHVPPRLGFFDGEIWDSCWRGGEFFPPYHHRSCRWLPLPSPRNGPLEKVDEDGRSDFGGWVVGRWIRCNSLIFLYCVVWLFNNQKYYIGTVTQGYPECTFEGIN